VLVGLSGCAHHGKKSRGEHPHMSQWTKIGIEWAAKYYIKMDDMHAYVIAMCELNFEFMSFNN
jgi:hypothetical protein